MILATRFTARVQVAHPIVLGGMGSVLTDIPDIVQGQVWPGAMNRVLRTRLIEEYTGREWLARQERAAIAVRLARARETGDVANGSLGTGQVAGLINSIEPAGELVTHVARDAEKIIADRLRSLIGTPA